MLLTYDFLLLFIYYIWSVMKKNLIFIFKQKNIKMLINGQIQIV